MSFGAWLLLPAVIGALGLIFSTAYRWFLREILTRAIEFLMLTALATWILGPRVGQAAGAFWSAVWRLTVDFVLLCARIASSLFRNRRGQ